MRGRFAAGLWALLVLSSAGCDNQVDGAYLRGGPRTARPGGEGPGILLPDGGSDEKTPIPTDPCGGLDYLGSCEGMTARWCNEGVPDERDCAAEGLECGWVSESVGYYCARGVAGQERPGGSTNPTNPAIPDAGTGTTDSGGSALAEGCGRPIETEELELTNEARTSGGLAPYVCDDILTKTARLHSQDMCDSGYFSHTSRDGRSHQDRIREQGGTFNSAGENIAWGQDSPAEVHRTWMNSGGHRRAIMSSGFTRIGIGMVDCNGRKYWTQNFAD